MDQRRRDLEIVRQTAELLSSGGALSETFERFCVMLAQFIDASVVFIVIVHDDGAWLEYAFDHGIKWRDAHVPVDPASQTQRVLDSGDSILIGSRAEIPGPIIPLRVPGAHDDDSMSSIFVPLRFGSKTIGVLSVQTHEPEAYIQADLRLIETCALYVAVAVQSERLRRETHAILSEYALDPVTGVATRRVFDQRLQEDWARARREKLAISLLLLDVDWFKRFNDTYGHVAGDSCLKQIAQAASGCLSRDSDLFARYGGEEFAAILWSTDTAGALTAAERMRDAIAALDIPHVDSPVGRITVSIGIATAEAASTTSDMLVRASDRALYAAKTSGRNRSVVDQFDTTAGRLGRRGAGNNLRPPTTSYVGRADETAAVLEALAESRIVTVAGPAGVGKTRTAVAAAQRRLYGYLDGVWFVDFQTIDSPEFVDSCIFSALGFSQHGGATSRDALVAELSEINALLIFDSCEHLGDSIRELCETLAVAAPQVRVLATAREPLGAQGERAIVLAPLEDGTAAELFEERARAAYPAGGAHHADRALSLDICTRLMGLPLAIELVAPYVRTMAPGALLASLDARSSSGLAATIEWSFSLLDERARRLAENLSVFPAAIDADALRDICADDVIEPWDVLDLLDTLIEKNLVTAQRSGNVERYLLPRTTRDVAAARLHARPDRMNVTRRHIRYYRALARRVGEQLVRGVVEASISLASIEWENLRTALERSLIDGLDPALGCDIVSSLSRFFSEAGRLSEGRFWCDRAIETLGDDPAVRADVFYAAAVIAHSCGDFDRLGELATELVEIHEASGDSALLSRSLNALGNARFKTGDPHSALALYTRALEHYERANDRRGIAIALMNLGSVTADWELDYAGARKLFEDSLEIFRALDISVNAGIVLANLGECCGYEEQYQEALHYAAESLSIFERLGNKTLIAWQLLDMARYHLELRECGEAATLVLAARRNLAMQPAAEHVLTFFETAFLFAYEAGAKDLAVRIAGFLEHHRAERRQPRAPSIRAPYDRRLQALEHAIGAGTFDRLKRTGAAATESSLGDEIEALAR